MREEERDGLRYFIVPTFRTAFFLYSPNDPFSAVRRLQNMPDEEYDVYHLFQPFLQAYWPWKSIKRKTKKGLFIYDWDDLWTGGLFQQPQGIKSRYLAYITSLLEKKIPEEADAMTVCSTFLKNRITSNIPIKLIFNGWWEQPMPDKTAMRKKWNFDTTLFHLGFIGKTADEMSWIIEGIDYLRERGMEDIRLVVCGPNKNFMQQSGYIDRPDIIYFGEVSPADAREIASSCQLGAIPLENSLFNQSRFPIKFLDFLTVNTPVYLSDVGEVGNIGRSLSNVYLASGEKSSWVKGLSEVIASIKKSESSNHSDVNALGQYNWISISKSLYAFYEEVHNRKNER